MSFKLPSLRPLEDKTIVLASASPRRREILTQMGINFQVVPTLVDDCNDPGVYSVPVQFAQDNAEWKAKEVYERCKKDPSLPDPDIVIGVDTIVVQGQTVLEKPRNKELAYMHLKCLSGSTHEVMTAVCVLFKHGREEPHERTCTGYTKIKFCELSDETINAYIETGEPLDKAGAYGIQGYGGVFVKSISGDYWNVVGLPKYELYKLLEGIAELYAKDKS